MYLMWEGFSEVRSLITSQNPLHIMNRELLPSRVGEFIQVGVNKPVSICQTWNLKVCRLETSAVTRPHDMLTGVKIYQYLNWTQFRYEFKLLHIREFRPRGYLSRNVENILLEIMKLKFMFLIKCQAFVKKKKKKETTEDGCFE